MLITQSSGASPSDVLMSYSEHTLEVGVLTLCRDAVGVFYSLSQLGWLMTESLDKDIRTHACTHVMVIAVGNEIADSSSNPICVSVHSEALGKGINSFLSSRVMVKIVGYT